MISKLRAEADRRRIERHNAIGSMPQERNKADGDDGLFRYVPLKVPGHDHQLLDREGTAQGDDQASSRCEHARGLCQVLLAYGTAQRHSPHATGLDGRRSSGIDHQEVEVGRRRVIRRRRSGREGDDAPPLCQEAHRFRHQVLAPPKQQTARPLLEAEQRADDRRGLGRMTGVLRETLPQIPAEHLAVIWIQAF